MLGELVSVAVGLTSTAEDVLVNEVPIGLTTVVSESVEKLPADDDELSEKIVDTIVMVLIEIVGTGAEQSAVPGTEDDHVGDETDVPSRSTAGRRADTCVS